LTDARSQLFLGAGTRYCDGSLTILQLMNKVLGCGFHKTGSTSLARALNHLGYSTASYSERLYGHWQRGRRWPIRLAAYRYDAYKGKPWSLCYADIDRWFPGTRFVLTVRDPENWYESLIRHVERLDRPQAALSPVYGRIALEDRAGMIARYLNHNAEVQAYFTGRPDLLVFDAAAGDGWDKLCTFLRLPVPDIPYPHAFKAS
jgi:hypothetical protein